MKKKVVIIGGSILSLFIAGTVFASSQLIIRFNGYADNVLPAGAKVEDGQLLVPIRWIANKLGATVIWNETDNAVEVQVPETRLLQAEINQLLAGLQPYTPKDAAELWLRGVRSRNGSLQYAVLSPTLQKQTVQAFKQTYWGTGGSSPWIDHINFTKEDKISDTKIKYTIEYDLKTSEGVVGKGQKTITVEQDQESGRNNWYITEIRSTKSKFEIFTPEETVLP